MYYKINPSGCCEKGGYVQVRFSFYLEKGDYGYAKHCVDKPIFPKEPYAGEEKGYKAWVESLPTEKIVNPFHNHFMRFSSDVSEQAIRAEGSRILAEAYAFWSAGQTPKIKNPPLGAKEVTVGIKAACEQRAQEIKQWQQ